MQMAASLRARRFHALGTLSMIDDKPDAFDAIDGLSVIAIG